MNEDKRQVNKKRNLERDHKENKRQDWDLRYVVILYNVMRRVTCTFYSAMYHDIPCDPYLCFFCNRYVTFQNCTIILIALQKLFVVW